jgi:hypothetical protein
MNSMGNEASTSEMGAPLLPVSGVNLTDGVVLMVGTYWMGPPSVKVASGLYPFHLLDFISLAAIPSAA